MRVHIDTLVLDGPVSGPSVARLAEHELARLLAAQLPHRLNGPGHIPRLAAPLPEGGADGTPLGSLLAVAVHRALGGTTTGLSETR